MDNSTGVMGDNWYRNAALQSGESCVEVEVMVPILFWKNDRKALQFFTVTELEILSLGLRSFIYCGEKSLEVR